MEVSALKYQGHAGIGLHSRSPLLRLQSDERLITLLRRGNTSAFEVLLARYQSRLLAFCRHLLGSREDAEDVLQEVMTAAFNAIVSDDRPINVRPWLYRIARNRCLNHLRRTQAVAVDTMNYQLAEHGATTADKVHEREEFRLLVGDIHNLPETQKTALVLREMDALSYEQIAEAMETTVLSVKSLLVRARLSLAEAAEARALSCEEVRIQAGRGRGGAAQAPEPARQAPPQGLRSLQRISDPAQAHQQGARGPAAGRPAGHRHGNSRCCTSVTTATTAGSASASAAGGATAAGGAGAGARPSAGAFSGSGGFISAGLGAVATKAAAGLAAAALVTAGAVEVNDAGHHHHHPAPTAGAVAQVTSTPVASSDAATRGSDGTPRRATLDRGDAVTRAHRAR